MVSGSRVQQVETAVMVSVVVGSFNRLEYLAGAVESIRHELEGVSREIIVVDGGSTDGTIDWLVSQKDVVTILQHNRGSWEGKPIERRSWGYFMNLGFRAATGKYICMLSDDSLVIPGAIKNGVRQFEEAARRTGAQKLGGIAFFWRNWPNDRKYWVGVTYADRLFINHGLYLRDALEAVGYIDAESYFFYHADSDLSLRMWEAGYETVEADDSFVEHHAHANETVRRTNSERQPDDWATYEARWAALGPPTEDRRFREYDDLTQTASRYWGEASPLPFKTRIANWLRGRS